MNAHSLTLSNTFDDDEAIITPPVDTVAARPELESQFEDERIADEAAIYRRMDQRRQRPSWIVPAAAALVLVAGGGALAFTLTGSHHLKQQQAQLASNQAVTPVPAASSPQTAPADQDVSAAATPATHSERTTHAAPIARSSEHARRAADRAEATAAIPPAPIPYAATARGAAADVSATQPAPSPTTPQTATPPVNPTTPSASGSGSNASATMPPPQTATPPAPTVTAPTPPVTPPAPPTQAAQPSPPPATGPGA
jgi:hypothetical protein